MIGDAAFRRFLERVRAPLATPAEFEELPTISEAKQIFRERPDYFAILTDQGRLTRDGTLTQPAWSAASDPKRQG